MPSIEVAIVDDDKLIAELLKSFLLNVPHINVGFTCYDGDELLPALKQATALPDVILLDLRMKNMNGVEALALVKEHYPNMKVVVLSSHYQLSFMGFMLKSGCHAFAPKNLSPTELITIVEEVYHKGHYFTSEQVGMMAEQLSNRVPEPVMDGKTVLTDREKEILQLICQQLTAKEIGEKLFIAQRTVEGHKNTILTKTGARNTAGLVIFAVQEGIINPDELRF